jgi:hypothetical protein
MVTEVKQRNLQPFLDGTAFSDSASHTASSEHLSQGDGSAEASNTVVEKWLSEHTDVSHIACIRSKRTRFVGLHNTPVGGVWATLDRDICMNSSLPSELCPKESNADKTSGSYPFPHAVLEIRREGAQSAVLINMLDRSHLVGDFHFQKSHQRARARVIVYTMSAC